jgi:hypothetical protein
MERNTPPASAEDRKLRAFHVSLEREMRTTQFWDLQHHNRYEFYVALLLRCSKAHVSHVRVDLFPAVLERVTESVAVVLIRTAVELLCAALAHHADLSARGSPVLRLMHWQLNVLWIDDSSGNGSRSGLRLHGKRKRQ